jgi:hypothetical protein
MEIAKNVVKLYQIIFIFSVLVVCPHPAFCEISQMDIHEEQLQLTDEQYKKYIHDFYSVFGKQMESDFGLKLVEGGFVHNFSNDKPEFYAYRRATLEEARALVLAVITKFADALRTDPIMLAYLHKLSLTPDSIGVNISFVNSHNWSDGDGSIDSVYSRHFWKDPNDVRRLYLQYHTKDPFGDVSDHDSKLYIDIEESFEDAVKLNATTSIINPAVHEPTGFEIELDQILASFKKEMEQKHGLHFQPFRWMISGKSTPYISEIRTKCTYFYPADCQEARALILLATEMLLTALNSSETLKPYLKDYPFSADQLKLRMLFRREKYFVGDVPYYDATIESVVLNDNTVTYYHHIPNTKDPSWYDRIVYAAESYQEAQKTLESTPPLALWKKMSKAVHYLWLKLNRFLGSALLAFLFAVALTIVVPQSWLLILPIIVILLLRRRRSPPQES